MTTSIRDLKQKWDDEDAARDERERRAKQLFLEEQANQIFVPIEDYLTRLDKVLRTAGGSVEIDRVWEHLGDYRLRRVAKVTSTVSRQKLPVELTIQGVSVYYRDRPYQLSRGVEALVVTITREVEQFLTLG